MTAYATALNVSRDEFLSLTQELPGVFDENTSRYLTEQMKDEIFPEEDNLSEYDEETGPSILDSNIVQGFPSLSQKKNIILSIKCIYIAIY